MNKYLISCFLFLLISFFSNSQTLQSTLEKYGTNYQPEKVYIQYDKSAYYSGETIWFKAYLMEGLVPAEQSKTLYVDWISNNGTVLSHTVSPIVESATNGQFEVPAEYAGNFVHVRAYTKWMLNFDTAFLYDKDIRILSKDSIKSKTLAGIVPSIQFFPEGGDIIEGIKNTIAFKANDQFGRPIKIKAKLVDEKGNLIQSFFSVHDGMGNFSFVPQKGRIYSVKWTDEKNAEHSSDLPKIKPDGISMQVAVNGTKRIVIVNSSLQIPDNLKQLHFIGTMNQQLVFQNDIALTDGGNIQRVIPTENLPSGILTLTLFDANWNAIAERITFVNNHDYSFETSLEVQRWGLSHRKRNEIEVKIPDSLIGSNLSVSVTDADIEKDTSDNIISHLLLSSEIKGRVYNPAYYFSNNSDSVSQHLDLVMLTNGWRRFKWEDVVKGKMPSINYERDTTYLSFSGKVFGVAKSQLTGKESIALIVKQDSATKFMIMPINTDATFGDPDIILFDTLRVYYSLKSKFLKQAEAKFMTGRLPAPNYTAFSKNFSNTGPIFDTSGTYRHSLLASKSLELLKIERGEIMKTVVVSTVKKSPVQVLDDKYSSGLFKSGDGYQFDLVNDNTAVAYPNALSYLQGKVAGLQINTTSNPPSLTWRGVTPTLFLDETQTDADMVGNIPVSDIAYIKVFRPPFFGAVGGGAGGAIAIYTRKGNDRLPSGRGLSSNLVMGYTPVKQFYSPNYDSFDPKNDHLDIRTTLYWNPLLTQNNKTQNIHFTFYNNDVTKTFRVVIEGMSKNGLLTHYEQILE